MWIKLHEIRGKKFKLSFFLYAVYIFILLIFYCIPFSFYIFMFLHHYCLKILMLKTFALPNISVKALVGSTSLADSVQLGNPVCQSSNCFMLFFPSASSKFASFRAQVDSSWVLAGSLYESCSDLIEHFYCESHLHVIKYYKHFFSII